MKRSSDVKIYVINFSNGSPDLELNVVKLLLTGILDVTKSGNTQEKYRELTEKALLCYDDSKKLNLKILVYLNRVVTKTFKGNIILI